MRRLGTDMWSGLVMLTVSVAVAAPALLGAVDPVIPRGWWAVLFAVVILALVLALARERPDRTGYALFATAVGCAWAVVLTAPHLGLLPVLLVVTAAASAYLTPLRVGFVLIGLNTAALALAMVLHDRDALDAVITVGFYLLIQVATLLSSVTLIREQRLRRELSEAHIDLRAASALLTESARITERLRISRDLHDLIGHQLTVLALELEAARHRGGEQAHEHVERANGGGARAPGRRAQDGQRAADRAVGPERGTAPGGARPARPGRVDRRGPRGPGRRGADGGPGARRAGDRHEHPAARRRPRAADLA